MIGLIPLLIVFILVQSGFLVRSNQGVQERVVVLNNGSIATDASGSVTQRRDDLVNKTSIVTRSDLFNGSPVTYVPIQFTYMDEPVTCTVPTPPEVKEYFHAKRR